MINKIPKEGKVYVTKRKLKRDEVDLDDIDLVIELRYGCLQPMLPKEGRERRSSCLPYRMWINFPTFICYFSIFCCQNLWLLLSILHGHHLVANGNLQSYMAIERKKKGWSQKRREEHVLKWQWTKGLYKKLRQ